MRAADAEDFTVFVHARSAALFRTALLLTGDRDRADDLVQATLEKVCRQWRKVAAADAPEAYARRMLVNLARDGWRRQSRRAEPLPLRADPAPPVDDPAGRIAQRDELLRALRRLPAGMRAVLVLRYFDDMPDESIADLMGVAPATVRSQAARGLAKLREAARDDADVLRPDFGGAA
ncbi:SigE family RNA polymerase sigma factor [Streptomyces sp. NPDC051940]|uniref:SigE family RNA polymerase sigma factor n=1 Tax=Streptomyces sp. NPDC051940 TaxID=3155675 RepID=UPI003421A49D